MQLHRKAASQSLESTLYACITFGQFELCTVTRLRRTSAFINALRFATAAVFKTGTLLTKQQQQ